MKIVHGASSHSILLERKEFARSCDGGSKRGVEGIREAGGGRQVWPDGARSVGREGKKKKKMGSLKN